MKKMEGKEFSDVFPNKQSLEIFSRMSELRTEIFHFKIQVRKSDMDPEAISKYILCG